MKLETLTITDGAGKQQKVTFIDSEKSDGFLDRNMGTIQVLGIVATLAVSLISVVVIVKNNFKKGV